MDVDEAKKNIKEIKETIIKKSTDKINILIDEQLKNKINEIYQNYKIVNKNLPNDIIETYQKVHCGKNISEELKSYIPLIQYVINEKNVYIKDENQYIKYIQSRQNYRMYYILNLLKETIKYMKKKKIKIPNITMYIWVSDAYPYYIQKLNTYPIHGFAAPENIIMPLIPDETYICFQVDEKYNGKCYTWDETKKMILTNCKNIKKTQNIIYFKGSDTTKHNHNLRKDLEIYANTNDIPLKILLDGWKDFKPIYEFCNYLHLLNLPGNYPWSNRLKYILIMDSNVISVNVVLKNIYPEYYEDKKYITFLDYILPSTEYIELIYTYYHKPFNLTNQEQIDHIKKLQDDEFKKLLKQLNDVYNDYLVNQQKYIDIAQNVKKKLLNLTNNNIYSFMSNYILKTDEILKK